MYDDSCMRPIKKGHFVNNKTSHTNTDWPSGNYFSSADKIFDNVSGYRYWAKDAEIAWSFLRCVFSHDEGMIC